MSPEALAAGHVAVAFRLAARLTRAAPWLRDEAESAALVGLWEAALSFDPARGYRFSTHADRRIRGAVRDALRDWAPRGYQRAGQRAGSAPPCVHAESEVPDALPAALAADASCPFDHRDWARALALVGRLTDRQRAVVVARHGLDGTPPRCGAEVAADMGVCKQRVQQVERRALALLRRWADEGTA
jgi:RNA polymerase sigma factor (sigma-70 family)